MALTSGGGREAPARKIFSSPSLKTKSQKENPPL